MKWLVIITGCVYCSWTDIKERRIPNNTIIIMLAIRAVLLVFELFTADVNLAENIKDMLLGAAVGATVMFVARVFSKESVGMGDVKLFMAIGAFVGFGQVFSVMLYTFFASAAVGIILVLLKKLKFKDSLPMAPFALIGLIVVLIIKLSRRY